MPLRRCAGPAAGPRSRGRGARRRKDHHAWTVALAAPFAAVLVFVVRPMMKPLLTGGGRACRRHAARFVTVLAGLFVGRVNS